MKESAIGETNERTTRHMNVTDGFLIIDQRDGAMQFERVFASREEAQRKIDALWLDFYSNDRNVSLRQVGNLKVIRRNSQ